MLGATLKTKLPSLTIAQRKSQRNANYAILKVVMQNPIIYSTQELFRI